jgi:signal transduction protein with GAF and PtsI domain
MRMKSSVRVPLAFATAATVVVLAGCASSKPGYCTDRTNLQNSIKGLTSLNTSSGVSGLKAQVQQIQSDATAVVNSAKSDFPTETSAITSSVNALKTSVAALPSSPSAAQVATVTKDAASVVSSVKNFVDASSSKCS